MLMNEKEKFYSLHPEMNYDSLLEKVKTDKDFVIAEHRKMWNAVADYSEKHNRCLQKYEYLASYCKDLSDILKNGCFLCTYGLYNKGDKGMCDYCLLQWGNELQCGNETQCGNELPCGNETHCCSSYDSPYRLLCFAMTNNTLDYVKYARIIANLQINEEVYNDEI